MNRLCTVLVLSLCILSLLPVSNAGSWDTYQNGYTNTGYTSENAPVDNATVKWAYETDNEVVASAAVSDDRVYVGTFAGDYFSTIYLLRQGGMEYAAAPNQTANLYALNETTGEVDWRTSVNGSMWASPAVVDETVYVGTLAGRVYGFDTDTGNVEWRFNAREPVFSLAGSEKHVYVGTRDYNSHDNYTHRDYPFYALNRNDGNVSWSVGIEEGVFAPASVTQDRVYVGGRNGTLYSLDKTRGEKSWEFETTGSDVLNDPLASAGGITSSPTVSDDTIYFGNYVGNLYAVNRSGGDIRWNYSIEGEPTSTLIASSPAVTEDTVYLGSYDDNLYAINATTGEPRWSFPTEGQIKDSAPIVANDTVYVGSMDGHMYALDASEGDEVWSYYIGSAIHSSPAVSEGSLYFTSLNGVHAVEEDLSGEPLTQRQGSDDGGEETARAHPELERDVPMGVFYLLLLSFGTVSVMAVGHIYYRRRQRGTDR